jgi:hypothetical protein
MIAVETFRNAAASRTVRTAGKTAEGFAATLLPTAEKCASPPWGLEAKSLDCFG